MQLSVTAHISDESSHDVDSSLVEWQSSDPWVASVSEGIVVTAVGGGNAVIGATYDGRTVEAPVVASSNVLNSALYRARDNIDEVRAHSGDLQATVAGNRSTEGGRDASYH